MKNIRIVHGTLLYPLEVGSRALIFEEGRYLHTSKQFPRKGVICPLHWRRQRAARADRYHSGAWRP